jgi:FlaA1/EpsC-like NDP-sugar epimerase
MPRIEILSALGHFLLRHRRPLVVSTHLVLAALSYYCAFLLRFDFSLGGQGRVFGQTLFLVLVVRGLTNYYFRLYQGLWRFVSVMDLLAIAKASFVGSLLLAGILGSVWGFHGYSRSVIVLDGVCNLVLMGGVRFLVRLMREHLQERRVTGGTRVLLVGAGHAGGMLLREMRGNDQLGYSPVGFVDDDPAKLGTLLHGVPVLGKLSEIAKLVEQYDVEEVIFSIPSASGRVLRGLLDQCREACSECDVQLKTVPGLGDLVEGKVRVSQIRSVDICDLLRREPVRLDSRPVLDCLEEHVVLVTGAGGSIGAELCRQIATFRPRRLIMFERSELNLYLIDLEMQERFPEIDTVPVIGDVVDRERVEGIMREHGVDVVYHAAAYKHVPLMESNPAAAVRNNVLGTVNTMRAADAAGVARFVLISTDKAVRPTNVMGASKRVCELFLQSFNECSLTNFVAVRFGNVLDSSGSVIPRFRKQILAGGPVTVTHAEVRRFFMLIPEAVELVLQAGAMGKGGEIFLLDMGEAIRIEDMARDLIRLMGLEPDVDIEIVYTGLRPGEKMYEELLLDDAERPTQVDKILIARPTRLPVQQLNQQIEVLVGAAQRLDQDGVVEALRLIVAEYQPSGLPAEAPVEVPIEAIR